MNHWENGGLERATGPVHLLLPLPGKQKWFISSDEGQEDSIALIFLFPVATIGNSGPLTEWKEVAWTQPVTPPPALWNDAHPTEPHRLGLGYLCFE